MTKLAISGQHGFFCEKPYEIPLFGGPGLSGVYKEIVSEKDAISGRKPRRLDD